MPHDAYGVLILLALILAVAGIIKPAWPCAAVAVLLICIALFTRMH